MVAGAACEQAGASRVAQAPNEDDATPITKAYQSLLAVQSAHVVKESFSSHLGSSLQIGPPVNNEPGGGIDKLRSLREQLVEGNCEEQGTYRACSLVDPETGKVVGQERFWGGKEITEGDFVPPDKFHYWETLVPDGPVGTRPAEEYLKVGGRVYDTHLGCWHLIGGGGSSRPLFWELFEWFGSVEQLADTELDGVPARHYLANSAYGGNGEGSTEWWISKERELPLKTVVVVKRQESEERVIHRFSNFDAHVEIPDPDSTDRKRVKSRAGESYCF